MDLIPIVDLAPWDEGGAAARASVARAVDAACREIGFMQVVGHGLPASVSQVLRQETEAFFELPLQRKLFGSGPQSANPNGGSEKPEQDQWEEGRQSNPAAKR